MDQFWHFAGSYWWLIFPVMGVAGGAGRAWQKSLERRHQRRMEILRVKSEIKTAQIAARTQPRVSVPANSPANVESTEALLQRLFDAHDAVTKRWLEYELDVAKLIAFPAMSDGRQQLTAAFLRAKKAADALRPASAKAKVSHETLTDYRNAVNEFEVAFDVAERDARRVRDSSFTDTERKRLDTAKQLLTVAIDQAATPAERQLAYRRVREELDGLISLSDGAIEVLEKKVSLELTAGTAASTPPRDTSGAAPLPTQWPVPARTGKGAETEASTPSGEG